MKAQILLPISIALTVASFGLIKIRLKDIINEEKRAKFQDVKLRVTGDVLREYEKEKEDTESMMEKAKKDQGELEKTLSELQSGGLDAKKEEMDSCTGIKKTALDEIGSLEGQIKTLQADTTKEKTDWEAELAALKQKLSTPSSICNYLKAGSSVQGLCPEKKEEPKAEPPKPEEKKAEEPKQEAPKPEAPKQNAPQPEEPKQNAPKPEEPKQNAPKPEEQKQEAPKQ